jgi:hypothetical protein
VVGLSAACADDVDLPPQGSSGTLPNAPKTGDGTERHDLDPLTSRIPALKGVVDATWYSGTFSTRDVPGPSTYWIDAVVTLPPGAADELRGTLDLTTATATPDVVGALDPALPTGEELLVGEELDEAFSYGSWLSTAYLSATGDTLVLVARGE